ncbi:hypothetical protein [Spongiactinospora sp. TRM90649]|uniref:hypothetical protein n=1 Tax=Spongiactinospora sp. TRM90649 TaxID=3031114 RepID=UPI0023FA47BE|nr:hypothetical protein [Spongiactinospora sp. TRM90649]MDF5758892.1 hypothetical protein [Spongiactinospora sp. TRM90649]
MGILLAVFVMGMSVHGFVVPRRFGRDLNGIPYRPGESNETWFGVGMRIVYGCTFALGAALMILFIVFP